MADIWFISDHHFDHANFLTFLDAGGNLIRPFKDVNQMNEMMVEQHNKVVKPHDKVYFGGDFGRLKFRSRLNGKIRLIIGNHDHFVPLEWNKHFERISSWKMFREFSKTFVFSHYPLHPQAFDYRTNGVPTWNVHGHIHEKVVMRGSVVDHQYVNVCVEQVNYTPVHVDQLLTMMREFE